MIRTYVDSGVLIAASRFEGASGLAAQAILDDPERTFVSSTFVRLEVMPKAIYHQRHDEVTFYEIYFDRVERWADEMDAIVADALEWAARHGLGALDALHVAAAAALGADQLVTTERPERPIHRVRDLTIVSIHPSAVL